MRLAPFYEELDGCAKPRWDYYVVGGRYEGLLNGKDIAPIRDVPEDFKSYAVLTPDGEWHEKGRVIWFGEAVDEKEEDVWLPEMRRLLALYPDHFVAVVDVHI